MAQNLTTGVPFATPVFDGASEKEIGDMLQIAYPEDIAKRKGLTTSRTRAYLCDGRTGEACREITETVGAAKRSAITANTALAGFTAGKILWVRKHLPEVYKACRHILLPKDYIRYCLTGQFATEVSDASGMNLLDVPRRKLGWEPGRRERLASLRALLRWTDKHQRENMVEIRRLLAPYGSKVVEGAPFPLF